MKSRYEQMLEAIANGEKITSEPTSRLEAFLKAFANKEGVSDLPEPTCREEEGWLSIIKGEPITTIPQCKREVFLKAIANKEPIPEESGFALEEKLFQKIIENQDVNVVNLNYVSDGIFYLREAFSAAQTVETLRLR